MGGGGKMEELLAKLPEGGDGGGGGGMGRRGGRGGPIKV